jgi:hypothetical protein
MEHLVAGDQRSQPAPERAAYPRIPSVRISPDYYDRLKALCERPEGAARPSLAAVTWWVVVNGIAWVEKDNARADKLRQKHEARIVVAVLGRSVPVLDTPGPGCALPVLDGGDRARTCRAVPSALVSVCGCTFAACASCAAALAAKRRDRRAARKGGAHA